MTTADEDHDGGAAERLRGHLRCQAAIGEAALSGSSAERFRADVVARLADALGVRACALLEPRADGLEVTAGEGWLPHVQPRRVPDPGPVGSGVHGLDELPKLAAARLLRAHDLGDGLVARVDLPRGHAGLLGVFGLPGGADADTRALVGTVAGLLGTGLERRDLVDRIEGHQRRLVEANELAHLGSYDWDIATDTNVWSDELYRIYGEEPGAFAASYDEFLARIHPDDRAAVMETHRRAFETLEPYQMQERIVRPDGSVRILATTGEVVVGDDGTPARMRGICFDITERVEAAERRDAMDRAESRRRQAFELNDTVLQGLTSVVWATERGDLDAAHLAAVDTLESARALMGRLLSGDAQLDLAGLVREEPPSAPLRDRWVAARAEPTGDLAGGGGDHPPGLRVVIADDADDLRLLLRLQLTTSWDCEVVGEAASGPEAVTVAAETAPDVVLLDLAMPGGSGLDAIPELRRVAPDARIVVLSGFSREHLGADAFDAGADAYVEKSSLEQLLTALAEVDPHVRRSDAPHP